MTEDSTMQLHDAMTDAVSGVTTDLDRLTDHAVRAGTRQRRRRTLVHSVGAAAATVALGVGGWATLAGHPTGPSGPVTAGQPAAPSTEPSEPTDLGPDLPLTPRRVAAALAAEVEETAPGALSRFQGDASGTEAMAALVLRPTTGDGPGGQVFLNLQPLDAVDGPPYTCASFMQHCEVRPLGDGDTLRTYRDDGDTESGAASRRTVVEVLSPRRDLRLVLFALNTNPWDAGRFRDGTVLTLPQLEDIAAQPWWSRTTVPQRYAERAASLPDLS
jgi:hypothetical protein